MAKKKEKKTVKEILLYSGIVFISVLMAIFFVGADILSSLVSGGKMNPAIIARIDGTDVHRLTFKDYGIAVGYPMNTEKEYARALDAYISTLLANKEMKNDGYKITDDEMVYFIKNIGFLQNPKTGKFDIARFNFYKERNKNYRKIFEKYIISKAYRDYIIDGVAVSKNEIIDDLKIKNSKIKIKYSYISNKDLKIRFKKELTPTPIEIQKEIASYKKSNPDKKDEKMIIANAKKSVENRKFAKFLNEKITLIGVLAKNNGSFMKANALINGKISFTNEFSIGSAPQDAIDKKKNLYSMTSSPTFTNKLLKTKIEATSPAIVTRNGLYIFSPIYVKIEEKAPSQKEIENTKQAIASYRGQFIYQNMMMKLYEKTKIVKNLKN